MLVWSKSACADLKKAEVQLLQQGQSDLGNNIGTRINQATEQLVRFPLGGKKGRIKGTRELKMPQMPYMIVYVPGERKQIEIVRIINTDRLWS
jgi:plasmid stabilization system protein ParE